MTRGEMVIEFISQYCRVPEGALVGQPMRLLDFQKRFIREIYDNPAGTKRAFLSVSRKNGKSGLIAAILLAHIAGPEAQLNSQIVSGAMSRDQAALVFGLASKMIMQDQRLAKVCKIIPSGKKIIGLARNVEYKALSADAQTAHGLSPILAILDEVGQIRGPTSDFVEAITTSQGAHKSPLLIAISTSAPSDADMFNQWIDDALRSGDPKAVAHVFKADEGCDLMDRAQWRKANPALGAFLNEEYIADKMEAAARLPSQEASTRNLLLNQRISLTGTWLAPTIWREASGAIDMEVFRAGNTVSLGLDLSRVNDLTAAVLAAADADGVVHLRCFAFTPLEGIDERSRRDRIPLEQWAREGVIYAPPGRTLDYDMIAAYLREELTREGISVSEIHFDRWGSADFWRACERQGFALDAVRHEVGQGYASMTTRVTAFETALLQGKLRHGGNPILNMGGATAMIVSDPAGNRKLTKPSLMGGPKIDGLIAAVMAAYPVVTQASVEVDVDAWVA